MATLTTVASSRHSGDTSDAASQQLWATSSSSSLSCSSRSHHCHRHDDHDHDGSVITNNDQPLPLLVEHPQLEILLHYAAQQTTYLSHYCEERKLSPSCDLRSIANRHIRLLIPKFDAHCSLDDDHNGNTLDTIPDTLQQCDAYIRAMSMVSGRVAANADRNQIIKSNRCVYVAFIRMTFTHYNGNSSNRSASGGVDDGVNHWIPYTGSASQFDRRWLQVPRRHTKIFDPKSHMSKIRCALWGDTTHIPHCDLAIAASLLQSYHNQSDDARVFVLVLDASNDQFRNLEAHAMRELPSLWSKSQSGLNKRHEHCTPPCRYCDTAIIGAHTITRPIIGTSVERKKKQFDERQLLETKRNSGIKRKATVAVDQPMTSPISSQTTTMDTSVSLLAPSSSSPSVTTTTTTSTSTCTAVSSMNNISNMVSFDTPTISAITDDPASNQPKKLRSLADDINDLFS